MSRHPGPQKQGLLKVDGRTLQELQRDYELVVDGGSRRLLEEKAYELGEVWQEVIRMNQLTDVSLGFATKNLVFIFKNQTVEVNIENLYMGKKEIE